MVVTLFFNSLLFDEASHCSSFRVTDIKTGNIALYHFRDDEGAWR
jgi:hypothetical protein